jgi:hypothetical protein
MLSEPRDRVMSSIRTGRQPRSVLEFHRHKPAPLSAVHFEVYNFSVLLRIPEVM